MVSTRKQRKLKIVEQLTQTLKESDSYFIVNYQGVTAPKIAKLRQELRNEQGRLQAVKKNLLRIALERAGNSELAKQPFAGQTAVVLGKKGVVAWAKTISDFAKEDKKPEFLGGFFEKGVLTGSDLASLASIPSREELLAKVTRTLKNPINRLILQTKGNQQKLVFILKEIARSKQA